MTSATPKGVLNLLVHRLFGAQTTRHVTAAGVEENAAVKAAADIFGLQGTELSSTIKGVMDSNAAEATDADRVMESWIHALLVFNGTIDESPRRAHAPSVDPAEVNLHPAAAQKATVRFFRMNGGSERWKEMVVRHSPQLDGSAFNATHNATMLGDKGGIGEDFFNLADVCGIVEGLQSSVVQVHKQPNIGANVQATRAVLLGDEYKRGLAQAVPGQGALQRMSGLGAHGQKFLLLVCKKALAPALQETRTAQAPVPAPAPARFLITQKSEGLALPRS